MIKATNANDIDNGLDGWVCRKCRRDAAPTSSSLSSRASTAAPVPAAPSPPSPPPAAAPSVSIGASVQAKLAADPSLSKRDPPSKGNKYKQSTVHKSSAAVPSVPRPPEKVPKTEAAADLAPPVITSETQPAKIETIPRVTASKRAPGGTEAVKVSTRNRDKAKAQATSAPSSKEATPAEASLLPLKKTPADVLEDLSSASGRAGAKKTAAKVTSKSSRAVIPPPISSSSGRHQSSSVVPDSEKESQFETPVGKRSQSRQHTTELQAPTFVTPKTASTSEGKRRAMDEDIRMSDSDDDLYGPPADQFRKKLSMLSSKDLDANKQDTPPLDSMASWMHRVVDGVKGDPWDRSAAKKQAYVPRSRSKVKARRLAEGAVNTENLVNFTKDEWLRAHRA
ncbi:hypothetical protein FIBSPDRAFT_849438, partial [Athelia psychrophila]